MATTIYFLLLLPTSNILSVNGTTTTTNTSQGEYISTHHGNNTKVGASLPPISPRQPVYFSSLKEICMLVNITGENCSCTRTPILCNFVASLEASNKTKHEYNFSLSAVYASVSLVTSLLGIMGNSAVILVSYKHRKGLPRYKKHITELALVDFIFSVVQIVDVIRLFWSVEWIYGIVMCKILRSALLLGSLLSIGFIMIIAMERYYGILYPLKKKKKEINILICLHIIVVIATIIPYMVSLKVDDKSKRCKEEWKGGKNASLVYQYYLAIMYCVLPVFLTSLLYKRILKHLSNQLERSHLMTSCSVRQRRVHENRRIMYILISIMVAFVLFTLPNRVIWIYGVTTGYKYISRNTYYVLVYISYLTYPFHICVNPIIYSVIDRKWRRNLISIFWQKDDSFSLTNLRGEEKASASSPLPEDIDHQSPNMKMQLFQSAKR